MKLIKKVVIEKITSKENIATTDIVLKEKEYIVEINNQLLGSFSCLDSMVHEFATGLLISKKIIIHHAEIETITMNGNTVHIKTTKRNQIYHIKQGKAIPFSFDKFASFLQYSQLFQQTGAVHASQLNIGNDIIFFEDISRHAMLDKAIGYFFLNKINPYPSSIFLTCRVTKSIIEKILLLNPLAIYTHSAVSDVAVTLAARHRIKLYGFVRNKRMNLYKR